MERAWRPNPGTSERPKDPNAMVWLRFRAGFDSPEPRRAGNFIWLHRGDHPGDIMFWAEAD